ncbi:MAG: L-histidine N(alpha)-methyltransferase [bacterium]
MSDESGNAIELLDCAPTADSFLDEVLRGLGRPQKSLPCKYFYDERGSALFERICELEEYYPTRTEVAIMRAHLPEMADLLGPGCMIVEYGSGNGMKIRLLLDHLKDPAAYVPVEISREHLLRAAAALSRDYPRLDVLPVCADFTGRFDLPRGKRPVARRIGFFPGSTIGNFTREEAAGLLGRISAVLGEGGGLLIGVDLKKDKAVLEAAYNDSLGVTRDFNLNILENINRTLGAGFRIDRFGHRAFYDDALGRIEMHLVSLEDQTVRVGGVEFSFAEGETIHTENSHKYSLEDFAGIAAEGGFAVRRVWTDPDRLFSVQHLTAESG